MAKISVQQMAERVSTLLGQKYKVAGDLAQRLTKARRRLPKAIYSAGEVLVSAQAMVENPRLLPQVDIEAVANAYDICVRHLNGLDLKDARRGRIVGVAGSIAFSLLVVAGLLVAVLHWRGYL